MSRIINESTSVVQVDSSGLQKDDVHILYVSTTTIPGQLVTALDATGFLSSPQGILLSTTGGAVFADGSFSTILQQGYAYITLVSQDTTTWKTVSISPFLNPSLPASYKGLDAHTVTSPQIINTAAVSSGTATLRSTDVLSTFSANQVTASTVYVNSLSRFLSSSPLDYRFTVNGSEHIYGSTTALGAGSFRGSISTGGDFFNTGNISSKLGTIYVGGDVTTTNSIRGQRGNIIRAAALSTLTTAGFVGYVSIGSTVSVNTSINARNITADTTRGVSMNVMSSIEFSPTQSIQNCLTYLEFVQSPITVPSTIRSIGVTASNSLMTSNITLQSFGPASTLSFLAMGSTVLANAAGSLQISSIEGNSLIDKYITSASVHGIRSLTTQFITMNQQTSSGEFLLDYPGGTLHVPNYWSISSIATNGTLNAPLTTISTNNLIMQSVKATTLNTVTDSFRNFYTNTVNARESVVFSSVNTMSIKNVRVNNSGGAILGSRTETIQSVHCSSMKADTISTGTAVMRFSGSNTFSLPVTYVSSLAANSIVTSSLRVSKVIMGDSEQYSTINSSTPWLLTSTYQMGASPFTDTTGLGTYFNEVSFVAAENQTAYYSIIDPAAQTPLYLSTPYVNTIAGTGISGTASTMTQIANKSQIGPILGQPASDSAYNLYIGAGGPAGWRLQRITPSGQLTTLAGNYQYFYGDGKYPLNAAFSPRLAVSIHTPGTLLITDISNVRIRYVTTDPIVTTLAGTGASAYSGDGGLAFYATFSTPTATATDLCGQIFIADTANQVIRNILGSTITTYAGTGIKGDTGDGGPANQARLNAPFGLTVDSVNNLLFTDLSNCVVRSITPSGTILCVAGSYTKGFGGDGGLAANALLSYPRGLAVDLSNNIYICDTGNSRIRRVDAATQIITTVAGNGSQAYGGDGGLAWNASLSTPTGVATDSLGNLYIADTENQCVRFVNMNTNIITTVAGRPRIAGYGGDMSFATFAFLNSPSHIAFDRSSGYYYIADDGNSRIRYVNSATKIIFTAAGNGSPFTAGDGAAAIDAVFGNITSVATDSSQNIYVSDGLGNSIRKIDALTSTITTVAGTGVPGFSGDGGLATAARLSSPQTVLIDTSSNIVFTDMNNQRVRKVFTQNHTIYTVAGTGVAGYNGDLLSSVQASLNYPKALTFDSDGALYVGDTSNFRIRRLDPTGFITTYAGNGIQDLLSNGNSLSDPIGVTHALTTDSANRVFVADSNTNALWRLDSNVNLLSALSTAAYLGDASPLSNAYFNQPTGLITDTCGNLVICDSGNSRIRRTYTFGNPLNDVYVNMTFNYTNYFTSTGSAYITLNGNLLATFNGSSQSNLSYSITDANILNYPLQGSNPVYGNQTPYIEITQMSTFGYAKLEGNLWVNEVPDQGFLQNVVDSNSGIIMNAGTLVFPYQNNGITIQNKYNDASLRTVNYTGSLIYPSDPVLKEHIRDANLSLCYTTLSALPLHRYAYIEPYVSTFHVRDKHRLGFLTSEVAVHFPNSITPTSLENAWAPSTINTLDLTQIQYAHFGATKGLISLISSLEMEVATLYEARAKLRATLAQRNSVL